MNTTNGTQSKANANSDGTTQDLSDELQECIAKIEGYGGQVMRIFSIFRRDVEAANVEPYALSLQVLVKNRQASLSHLQNVHIMVTGYNEDSRELYEIPEVRAFFSLLNEKFPFWYFILAPDSNFLQILYFCLCENSWPSVGPKPGYKYRELPGLEAWRFIEPHMIAMMSLLAMYDLNDENDTIFMQIVKSVFPQLGMPCPNISG